MKFQQWQTVFGSVLGVVLGGSAMAVHGHVDAHAHGGPDRDLLSISGSPAQLAERSERLAVHVCEVIEAGETCALTGLAAEASRDLQALQGRYQEGQQALHLALVSNASTAEERDATVAAQLAMIEHSSRRYLRYLADAADTLTPEQKQRFMH